MYHAIILEVNKVNVHPITSVLKTLEHTKMVEGLDHFKPEKTEY